MDTQKYLNELLASSRKAQEEFAAYPQEKVDEAVRAIGKAVYDHAEELAALAVEETRMGRVDSKIAKCRNKSKSTWWRMKGKKSRGIIERDEETGIVKVAKPIGVVGCVTATTNPVINPMHNSMCALKCGNAVIISPHPRAKRVGARTVELMNEALDRLGMPKNLIQIIAEPTMELSAGLMKSADLCICTGGPALVKTAYSSGKPVYGVGQGNVQVLVDRDVDFNEAAKMIIEGRTFDNGVLCTCEQNIICPRDKAEEMIAAVKANGAYYIGTQEEADKVRDSAFPDGVFNKAWTGTTVQEMAELAGLKDVPQDAKVIVCCTRGYARDEVLAKEKLFPMLALFLYDTWEEMIAAVKANGAYYIGTQEEADKVRDSAFPDGVFNKAWTGTTVQEMAELAGLKDAPQDAKVIVCCTRGYARDEVLAKEKLFPMLALFLYDTWEEAMEIARANLAVEGMGHSVVIHSNTQEHIEAVPNVVNVSRYAVNQVGGTALGGAMDNGLNPTTTLGCGTWGNNIISENLWYTHLMNVSRISYRVPDMYIPTDEEIWAD